jgi:hypothetical protein
LDTIDEYEGRGYFSILFDEVIKEIALENEGALPQVLISERGVTARGRNFDTYLQIMRTRGFEIDELERPIDPTQTFIAADLSNVLFKLDPKKDFREQRADLKRVVESQPFQAFFLHGAFPKTKTLEDFVAEQEARLSEKVGAGKIRIMEKPGVDIASAKAAQPGQEKTR